MYNEITFGSKIKKNFKQNIEKEKKEEEKRKKKKTKKKKKEKRKLPNFLYKNEMLL